jgi:hypothetical protein
MDSGLTVRATGSTTQTSHAPTPTRQTVATDLASSQTVNATASAANVGNDTGHGQASDSSRMPTAVLDAQSREIIDRSANAPLRRVTRQTPDIVARRLKAYMRPARVAADAQDEHADFEV